VRGCSLFLRRHVSLSTRSLRSVSDVTESLPVNGCLPFSSRIRIGIAAPFRFLLLIQLLLASSASAGITLVDHATTGYRIVLPHSAIPAERYAADELQRYVEKISGARLPIVTDAEKPNAREIVLGENSHLGEMGAKIEFDKLGPDGFVLVTDGERLIIAGGRPRGTLNAVYSLLEEKLGVRWFTPTIEVVPKKEEIVLPDLDERRVPVFENRDTDWSEATHNADFAARHHLNGYHSDLQEKHGGASALYYPWVHTFDYLVPPGLYREHPEYFPLIDGKRKGGYVQRCLTNPDVLKISIERVRQWIKEHPEVTIISVSQNDTFDNCQCERCKAIDDAEGSPAGSLLNFVNAVAEAIEPEHPNIRIDTLAYLYTRKPPKTIRPRRNVIVRLCSYECCFAHPIESCSAEENRRFGEDIASWSRIAPSLYVWDYTTNFAHYQQPFPNFNSAQPNLRFFAQHGIKGLYEEGNGSSGGNGEMEPLRTYVLAELLWNPDTDVQKHINEFTSAYYGNAAPKILAYLDLIHRRGLEKDGHTYIYDEPTSAYLNAGVLKAAEQILDQAEELAQNDDVRFRVQVARLPIWYVKIATRRVAGKGRKVLAKRFLAIARKAGISHISAAMTMDQWALKLGLR
jgi:hypothetical protein